MLLIIVTLYVLFSIIQIYVALVFFSFFFLLLFKCEKLLLVILTTPKTTIVSFHHQLNSNTIKNYHQHKMCDLKGEDEENANIKAVAKAWEIVQVMMQYEEDDEEKSVGVLS